MGSLLGSLFFPLLLVSCVSFMSVLCTCLFKFVCLAILCIAHTFWILQIHYFKRWVVL